MPGIRSFSLFLFFFFGAFLNADEQEDSSPMPVYKIHEAFITDISEIAVEPVDISPPAALKEKVPPQPNPEVIWIPGYWSWEDTHNDFVWVSGIWRRPPQKMVWMSGEWKQFDESWVWVKGFWSQIPLSETQFLADEPPEPLSDSPDDEGSEEVFWVGGCWIYDWAKAKYVWQSGDWAERDPDQILVPCHYKWRPEGFVYVPSYWDWPFESRGSVYSPVYVSESERQGYIYEPQQPYTPIQIVQNLFPDYPNYVTIYDYYSHYHPEYWSDFAEMPPWWNWRSWWSLDSEDQWALWWWYGNPGYPQPSWLTDDIAALFPVAPLRYRRFFSWDRRPFFVTPFGVYSARELFRARNEAFGLSGRRASRPFLFRNHKFWDRLENRLDRKEARQRIRPAGNWKNWKAERPQQVPEAIRRKKGSTPQTKQTSPAAKERKEDTELNPLKTWERVREWGNGIRNRGRDRDGDGMPNRRDPDFKRQGAANGKRPSQQVQPQSPAVQQAIQQELTRRRQIRRQQKVRGQNQNQQQQNQPQQRGQIQNQQQRETEQLEQQWQRTRHFRREQQIQNNANIQHLRERQVQDETRPWRGGGGQRQEVRQHRQETRQEARPERQESRQEMRQERRQQRQDK